MNSPVLPDALRKVSIFLCSLFYTHTYCMAHTVCRISYGSYNNTKGGDTKKLPEDLKNSSPKLDGVLILENTNLSPKIWENIPR